MTATLAQRELAEASVPAFVPVHAASMNLPIWNQLVAELGEPNLNPQEPLDWDEPEPWLEQIIELHKPEVSLKALAPAWPQDTGQYFIDRVAYAQWLDRMKGPKQDKETDGTRTGND